MVANRVGASLPWTRVQICLAVTLLWSCGALAQSGNHGDGHAQHHDVYKGWAQSNGFSSCCNGDDPATGAKGDCRPVKAYRDPDDDLWRALINGQWRVVPPLAVRPYPTPDGNSHVCESEGNGIMCFVGGLPKS